MNLKLIRYDEDENQIIGKLDVVDDNGDTLYSFSTLELPWKNNQRRVSCIPYGRYMVIKRWSEKYGNHFILLDVPNRDYILIHFGNYKRDTKGCILVGDGVTDINGDGLLDVTNSKNTMKKLNKIFSNIEEFEIEIV